MYDLHCHLLPGIDDGPPELAVSLEMARIAAGDGILVTACTPHIHHGVYDTQPSAIAAGVSALRIALAEHDIPLQLVEGSDAHVSAQFVAEIRSGRLVRLNQSRYILFEPTHHVLTPGMDDVLFDILAAGYVPILTHPERLQWASDHMDLLRRLADSGVWMQITAGSLAGRFGKRAEALAEEMVSEGLAHVIATDAHSIRRRPPLLSEGLRAAERLVGAEEARHMVVTRPLAVIEDRIIALPSPRSEPVIRKSIFGRLFARR